MLPYLNVLSHHSHESESTEMQLTDTHIHTNENQATHEDTGRTLDRQQFLFKPIITCL